MSRPNEHPDPYRITRAEVVTALKIFGALALAYAAAISLAALGIALGIPDIPPVT